MNIMGLRTFMVVSAILAGGLAFLVLSLIPPIPPLPDVENAWWGEGDPKSDDKTITPFSINISDEILDDLHERLEITSRAVPPLKGTNFEYGFNSEYLQKVVDYWMNEYKWRDREAKLNQFPQFKTQISGLSVHFLHVKPKPSDAEGRKVVPLLLLHGWPGSIVEFYRIIPMLTSPRKGENILFELVVPSLPGYGFSEGAHRPGLGAVEMAPIFRKLMERLGHNKFYVQGGDWGSIITSNMGTLFEDSVLGIHLNLCILDSPLSYLKSFIGSFYPTLFMSEEIARLSYPLGTKYAHLIEEMGYAHIQATKPDTIGAVLNDSPSGLAAYILEKFSTWTNAKWRSLPDGGLSHYSMDDLLDNVMIYWVTGSITTSFRLYSETVNKKYFVMDMPRIPCNVPTSCAAFPNELLVHSEWILRDKFPNLVTHSLQPKGGHFAAFEVPEVLAEDVWLSIAHMERNKEKGTSTGSKKQNQ